MSDFHNLVGPGGPCPGGCRTSPFLLGEGSVEPPLALCPAANRQDVCKSLHLSWSSSSGGGLLIVDQITTLALGINKTICTIQLLQSEPGGRDQPVEGPNTMNESSHLCNETCYGRSSIKLAPLLKEIRNPAMAIPSRLGRSISCGAGQQHPSSSVAACRLPFGRVS